MKHLMSLGTLLILLAVLAACAAPTAVPQDPAAAPQPTVAPTDTPVPTPAPTPAPPTPADVVMGWAERLNAGDVEGALALWADDGIWYFFGLPPNGSDMIKGKEALRTEFANEIADNLKVQFEIKSVVGNEVTSHDTTWMDFTRQLGVAPLEATGQFLVEDGKISTYAWTLDPESVDRLKVALGEAMPELLEAPPESSASTETPVSEITVTVAGGTCSYEGPLVLRAGKVQVTLDVQDQNRDHYALFFLTLDPDKDFLDLMAATTGAPPSWSRLLPYFDVGPGTSRTYSITVTEGPLYGICGSKYPDHPIGNFGPFEVVSAAADTSVTQPASVSANQDQTTTLPPECRSLGSANVPSELEAKDVPNEMVSRLNDGDVAGAMAYFAGDARSYVFGVPPVALETSIGREAICQGLAEDVGDNLEWDLTILTWFNSPSGALITAKSRIWLDAYRQLAVAPLEFYTRFKVKDGRIIDHAMWLERESLANLRSVMPEIVPSMASPSVDPPGSDVTMVFSDDLCLYEGPSVWKAGAMNFALVTAHQAEDQNGYVIITMDEGYDVFDLAAATSSDRPSWVRYSNIFEFGQEQGAPVQHRVFENINYYLLCFSDINTLAPVGLYGPFAVTE